MRELGLVWVVLCCVVWVVNGAIEFPVYRVAQVDASVQVLPGVGLAAPSSASGTAMGDDEDEDGAVTDDQGRLQLGSRLSAVNLKASPVHVGDDDGEDLLNRRVAVLKMEDLTSDRLKSLVEERHVGAMLVLLPAAGSPAPSDEVLAQWRQLEASLVSSAWPLPLYFAQSTPELEGVYATLYDAGAVSTGDEYTLSVGGSAVPAPLGSIDAKNLQAVLGGSLSDTQGSTAPTIAIVAHTDTFSAIPGLPSGSDSNGSGVVAVLELARMFARLYSDAASRSRYNVLFMLSGAGKQIYSGSKHWLDNTDPTVLKSVAFVLCLDAIGSSNNLHLHTSKPASAPAVVSLLGALSSAAAPNGVSVTHVHRKINVKRPHRAWEHEVYATKGLFGATLSALASPDDQARASAFGTPVDAAVLATNIKAVAEGVAAFMYSTATEGGAAGSDASTSPPDVFVGDLEVNTRAVGAWLDVFARETRFTPSMSPTGRFLGGLQDFLEQLPAVDVSASRFRVDVPEVVYYDQVGSPASLFRVKSVWFDVSLGVGLLVYLLAMFVVIKGRDAGTVLAGLMKPSATKKTK